MKSMIVVLLGAVVLSGCSSISNGMQDLRYPLPSPSGGERQLNRGEWVWDGVRRF